MALHVLRTEQQLEGSPEEVFPFFGDALNLEAITPPWLGFRVTMPQPIEMRPGTLIDYRLRLHGVPVRWRTRIAVWEPPHRFVDVQLRGPYRVWHHTHEFEPAPGGRTTMRDIVRYSMPFGPFGSLAQRLLVARDLEQIFEYRQAAVARLLASGA